MSAPYNPRFNRLAESAVKIVKNILKKCSEEDGNPERALYEWRNLPCDHGYSPAQLMFGRRQRVSLPMHESSFSQVDFSQAALEKDKKFSSQATSHNRGKMVLPMLAVGQVVRVQDDRSGLWPTLAKVMEICPDRLSYIVESDGKEMLRSRAMLRVEKPSLGTNQGQGQVSERRGVSPPASSQDLDLKPLPTVPLCRSDRLKDKFFLNFCDMCNSESKEEKLREFRKLQRLAWAEQQAEQAANDHSRPKSADQTIN